MGDEIRRIEQTTKTLARKNKFDLASSASLPDIEIPETKLSLTSAIGLLEDFLGVAPRHASAELIFASGPDWHESDVTIRPKGCTAVYADQSFTGANGFAPPAPDMERVVISVRMPGKNCWTEVMVHSPDDAVTRAAREIIELTNPYLLAVYAYEVENDFKTALLLMQEASEREPKNILFYNGSGVVLAKQGKRDEAIAKYQQAIALDPKNAVAYLNWGVALDEKQDYEGAIAKYQQAIAFDPKYADVYTNWGAVLGHKQDCDGAIAKYQQALALEPENELFRNNLDRARQAKTQTH